MARPRTITDERILGVARACFLEQGPQASTNTIAERLGISQAALFKRFGTKEELMIAALVPPAPAWQARLAEGPDERPIREQLRDLAGHMLAFMSKLMPCMMVLRASGVSHERLFARFDEPPPIRSQRLLAEWFRRAREQGRIRSGEPAILATAFQGSVNSAVFLQQLGGPGAPSLDPGFVDGLVDLFWRALEPG